MTIPSYDGSQAAERRRAVYDAITGFKQQHGGKSPSIRELMELTQIPSTSMICFYLDQLQEQEVLLLGNKHSARDIVLPGEQYIPPANVEIR